MKLADLPENFTLVQFMELDRESLDQVPFTLIRWQCKIKLCHRFTRLRDYGLHHWYYSPRGISNVQTGEVKHWIDLRHEKGEMLICYKHKKYWGLPIENIPLKRSKNGGIIWGGDYTGKEIIIY